MPQIKNHRTKKFAGKPIAARRDDEGNITYLLFQYRSRATHIETVKTLIDQKNTEGLIYREEEGCSIKLVVMPEYADVIVLEGLPEL